MHALYLIAQKWIQWHHDCFVGIKFVGVTSFDVKADMIQNYLNVLNWWLLHKCPNEPCQTLLWHSWHIKATFIDTENTHWIQQFVLVASEEGRFHGT